LTWVKIEPSNNFSESLTKQTVTQSKYYVSSSKSLEKFGNLPTGELLGKLRVELMQNILKLQKA